MIVEAKSQDPNDYEVVNRYYSWGADFNLARVRRGCGSRCIKDRVQTYLNSLPAGGHPNFVLGSHDISRVATRIGTQMVGAFNMLLLTLPGTPTTYYGEEIGMEDIKITSRTMKDPRGSRLGLRFSRDPQRSPMQWSSTGNGGFSNNSKTWLPINQKYLLLNVEVQKASDGLTTLGAYRRLAQLRQRRAFYNGTMQFSVVTDMVLSYVRATADEKYLVAINFGSREFTGDFSGEPLYATLGEIIAFTENTDTSVYRYKHVNILNRLSLYPGQGIVVRALTR